jgi:hypothetical protein
MAVKDDRAPESAWNDRRKSLHGSICADIPSVPMMVRRPLKFGRARAYKRLQDKQDKPLHRAIIIMYNCLIRSAWLCPPP